MGLAVIGMTSWSWVGVRHARASPAGKDVFHELRGCHVFAGGDREREALTDAIDEVASDFNFLVRPIVRRRLEEANPVIGRVCVFRTGGAVSVSLDGRKYTAPLNGKPVEVRGITGDEVALRSRVGQGALWQMFEGEEGGRINRFRPTESGVEMKVRVFSERLPRDLVYTLTYRRPARSR